MTDGSEHPKISAELLVRYIEDRCTEAEKAIIESWKISAPAEDQTILALSTLLKELAQDKVYEAQNVPSAAAARELPAAIKMDISHRADAIMRGTSIPSEPFGGFTRRIPTTRDAHRPRYARTVRYAITAVATFLIAFGGVRTVLNRMQEPAAGQASSYTTAAGERTTIVLPDGSSVVMSVASRLDVPANYGVSDRTLYLQGEGLFSVASASSIPFVVHTGNTTTKVLGTTFSVRNYTTDTAVLVAVRDGKVSVGDAVLIAGEQIIVGSQSSSSVLEASSGIFDFATGQLNIENMKVRDAVIELSRWYNIDVRIGDPALNHRRIKGQFKSESLADLAAILEWSLGVRVIRDGRTLTLFPEL